MVLYRIRGDTFIMRGSTTSGMVAVGERARGFGFAVVECWGRSGVGLGCGGWSCAVEVGALTGVGSCTRNVSAGHEL